jgi:hypothetical protein
MPGLAGEVANPTAQHRAEPLVSVSGAQQKAPPGAGLEFVAAAGTPYREFVKERLEQAGRTPGLTNRRPQLVITSVREASRFGSCNFLGELVAETSTRYIYRRRHTSQIAFVDKGSPSVHVEPCQACPDYRNAHR